MTIEIGGAQKPDLAAVKMQLPVPPTDNRYYGKPKGARHKYLTRTGKAFRHNVATIVNERGFRGAFGKHKIGIKVVLHLAHGGDIWNRLKALGDALQYSEIFDDDKQICDSRIVRGHRVAGGRCEVTLWRM